MNTVLVLGVLLVVFGGIVLIRFPDRPGGTLTVRGVQFSCAGAGFPLVVVGAALVVASAFGLADQIGDAKNASASETTTTTLAPTSTSQATGVTVTTTAGSPVTNRSTTSRSSGGADTQPSTSSTRAPGTAPTTTSSTTTFTSTVSPGQTDTCFDSYFKGVAADRIKGIEVGATSDLLVDQPKEGLIGLILKSANQAIGATRFQFLAENQIFKVESVVDFECAAVDFKNATRPGASRYELKSAEALEISLADTNYFLQLTDRGSMIRAFFKR